ncbi:ribosome small subunit-dependent GTPase A [Tissierella sp.]|uniref:ribosome small subunit-dependent GTPase A n=1 Tax=Tissierella sp. TaxID=41274 RepID=UPI00286128FB|nr:ribosome small subunit-dependent GTPase A [Tissierella sp.]MDR7855543.1 ribosome small subunit-dependent GTPase A [Tissierella sp.]
MRFEEIYKNEKILTREDGNLIIARVNEVQRELFRVLCQYGETNAKLKGTFYKDKMNKDYPVVGDYVLLKYNENGYSLIEEICERKSYFSRTDFSGHAAGYVKTVKEQVIAANFDYVFILSSLNHDFNLNRLTRYISVSLQSGGKPIVILTKADECHNPDTYIEQVKSISQKADVFAISAKTGYGMKQLDMYIQAGKTIVFLGSSGVGKSTLVNAIAGEEIMAVSNIRENDSKGRHTTTHRQLIELASGVIVIDTPGIRELGMWDAEKGINDTFSDVIQLFDKCKYRNCIHDKEPGCAVNQAIKEGILSRERWKTYCQLSKENQWGKNKSAYTKKEKLDNKIKVGKIKKN